MIFRTVSLYNKIMYYSIEGILSLKGGRFVVIEVNGIGYKIHVSETILAGSLKIGMNVKFFVFHHLKEEISELYGFLEASDLSFFEDLVSISGVGPRSALSIIDLAPAVDLQAAISSGKSDFLSRASGIGKKTAERIILELKNKFKDRGEGVKRLESDLELEGALISLGYQKSDVRKAIADLPEKEDSFQNKLKLVLKILGKN